MDGGGAAAGGHRPRATPGPLLRRAGGRHVDQVPLFQTLDLMRSNLRIEFDGGYVNDPSSVPLCIHFVAIRDEKLQLHWL